MASKTTYRSEHNGATAEFATTRAIGVCVWVAHTEASRAAWIEHCTKLGEKVGPDMIARTPAAGVFGVYGWSRDRKAAATMIRDAEKRFGSVRVEAAVAA